VAIRSVLWIGCAKGLADSTLPDSPRYDVVWQRDARAPCFDAIVIEACDANHAEASQ
jgi:hypothetical protein